PQPRTETDKEFRDLHARALGRDEVAELVQHDDEEEREEHRDERGLRREEHRDENEAEDGADRDQDRLALTDVEICKRIAGPHVVLLCFTAAAARSRARRSASRTSDTSSAFPIPPRSVSSTITAISHHAIRPARNASTATSLEAERIAGA